MGGVENPTLHGSSLEPITKDTLLKLHSHASDLISQFCTISGWHASEYNAHAHVTEMIPDPACTEVRIFVNEAEYMPETEECLPSPKKHRYQLILNELNGEKMSA